MYRVTRLPMKRITRLIDLVGLRGRKLLLIRLRWLRLLVRLLLRLMRRTLLIGLFWRVVILSRRLVNIVLRCRNSMLLRRWMNILSLRRRTLTVVMVMVSRLLSLMLNLLIGLISRIARLYVGVVRNVLTSVRVLVEDAAVKVLRIAF